MLAARRSCLGYLKVYCVDKKRWFLAWNQNKHITYYIFHIQFTNYEIFFTFAPTSFDDTELIITRLYLVCSKPTSTVVRASVSLLIYVNHFVTVIIQSMLQSDTTYFSTSDRSTLDFCSLTSPTCSNLPPKCPPVKYENFQAVLLTRFALHGQSF